MTVAGAGATLDHLVRPLDRHDHGRVLGLILDLVLLPPLALAPELDQFHPGIEAGVAALMDARSNMTAGAEVGVVAVAQHQKAVIVAQPLTKERVGLSAGALRHLLEDAAALIPRTRTEVDRTRSGRIEYCISICLA